MYAGRSVGRLIAWLQRLTPNQADYVQFGYEDGSVRLHDEIVIRKIDWDEYDTPIFDFVLEGHITLQDRVRTEVLLSEHRLLQHLLRDEEIEALEGLDKEPFFAKGVRRRDAPAALASLLKRYLVEEKEEEPGWDEEGQYICNLTIEITPQARGFLKYLRGPQSK